MWMRMATTLRRRRPIWGWNTRRHLLLKRQSQERSSEWLYPNSTLAEEMEEALPVLKDGFTWLQETIALLVLTGMLLVKETLAPGRTGLTCGNEALPRVNRTLLTPYAWASDAVWKKHRSQNRSVYSFMTATWWAKGPWSPSHHHFPRMSFGITASLV